MRSRSSKSGQRGKGAVRSGCSTGEGETGHGGPPGSGRRQAGRTMLPPRALRWHTPRSLSAPALLAFLGVFLIGLSKAGFATGLGMLSTPLVAQALPCPRRDRRRSAPPLPRRRAHARRLLAALGRAARGLAARRGARRHRPRHRVRHDDQRAGAPPLDRRDRPRSDDAARSSATTSTLTRSTGRRRGRASSSASPPDSARRSPTPPARSSPSTSSRSGWRRRASSRRPASSSP